MFSRKYLGLISIKLNDKQGGKRMSDIKNSVLPEIIEPISNAIQQNIPETQSKQMELCLLLSVFSIMWFYIL